MYNYPYLKDESFLLEIDHMQIKEQLVKITALNFFTEFPIDEIQGKVISGNVSLDGNSSLRRTCNLTLFLDNSNNKIFNLDNIIAMDKKIKLEIGFKNTTSRYLNYDILWFPLGIYLIINPSISHSTQGLTISLQMKDKMTLLNGEIAGVLPAATVFHEIEIEDEETGEITISKPTIRQIIEELVHHLGGQPLDKIIIRDLEDEIKQYYRWSNGEQSLYIKEDNGEYSLLTDEPKLNKEGYKEYFYGKIVGYQNIPFEYPGELISSPGESITSVLDKIKNTLGNYEYFYDIDGNFIFQEIKNYLNTTQSKNVADILKNGFVNNIDISKKKAVYLFNNNNLVTSYSLNPSYSNIKNDFIIWGTLSTGDGSAYPLRYHLVIDKKPEIAENETEEVYSYLMDYNLENETITESFYPKSSVGREKWLQKLSIMNNRIINDYNKLDNETGYEKFEKKSNSPNEYNYGPLPDAIVKYNEEFSTEEVEGSAEMRYYNYIYNYKYYSDYYFRNLLNLKYTFEELWYDYLGINSTPGSLDGIEGRPKLREYLDDLHNKIFEYRQKLINQQIFLNKQKDNNSNNTDTTIIPINDWRTKLYLDGLKSEIGLGEYANDYYIELKNEWPRIYDILEGKFKDLSTLDLVYFLDFLDPTGSGSEISSLMVNKIGRRTKVISNDKINCIYADEEILDLLLIPAGFNNTADLRAKAVSQNLKFIQVSDFIYNNLASGTYYQSAFEEVKTLLQKHTYYSEAISLTAMPIYYLEPNTRITVEDEVSGITGDFIINRITLPLDIKGTMTISATRAFEYY